MSSKYIDENETIKFKILSKINIKDSRTHLYIIYMLGMKMSKTDTQTLY